MRPPDFVIGEPDAPYMLRWYVIPKNRYFNIYLHKVLRDDDDRALHDHPWFNLSIILRGGYIEYLSDRRPKVRRPGQIIFRRPERAHRLALRAGRPSWSLFLTGPHRRTWGFYCPKGWVPWKEFVDLREGGNKRGAGCP